MRCKLKSGHHPVLLKIPCQFRRSPWNTHFDGDVRSCLGYAWIIAQSFFNPQTSIFQNDRVTIIISRGNILQLSNTSVSYFLPSYASPKEADGPDFTMLSSWREWTVDGRLIRRSHAHARLPSHAYPWWMTWTKKWDQIPNSPNPPQRNLWSGVNFTVYSDARAM